MPVKCYACQGAEPEAMDALTWEAQVMPVTSVCTAASKLMPAHV